jgi:hypothetical protein
VSPASSDALGRLARAARRHELLAAALVLLAICCAWFWPLLAGRQLTQSYQLAYSIPWRGSVQLGDLPRRGVFPDAALAFHPWVEVARDQLRDGHLPLWNPHEYAGTPLLGNMQSALLFPLTWALLALPFGYAWGVVALLKVVAAGLGCYALSRELRSSRGGALLAGTVYMLSAPMMAWLQWPLSSTYAVYPWLLLATVRAVLSGGPGAAAATAAAVALTVFAGHPETAVIALSAAGVLALALAVLEHGPGGRRARAFAWWVLGVLLGLAATAAVAVPFVQALDGSVTTEYHAERASLHLPLSQSLAYLMPDLFGNGKPSVYGAFYFNIVAASFGLPALVLALVALARNRRAPAAIALAAMVLLAATAAYAIPPVRWFVESVPPWSRTVFAERVNFVIALAGAVGAGAGFTTLARRPLGRRWIALAVGGVAALTALGVALAEWRDVLPTPASAERRAAWIFALGLLGSAVLLALIGRVRRPLGLVLALAVAALSVIQLQGLNAWLPPAQAHPARPAAVDALRHAPKPSRVAVIRGANALEVMPPNTLARYGIDGIEGYDFPLSRTWSDFQSVALHFAGLRPESRVAKTAPDAPTVNAMRAFNVGYYIARPGTSAPDPRLETAYSGPDATVFRDPGAMPRAWVVPRAHPLPALETVIRFAGGTPNPRREALVPPGSPPAPTDGGGFRPARVEELAPDHVRVHLAPGSAGWLVLANAYTPTWKAEIDGDEVGITRTNYAAMGVPVSRGARVVDFRLDRTGFWLGAALSCAALTAIAALAVLGRRRPA